MNSPPHSAQTLLLALRQNRTRDAHKISPHATMTKRQLWTGATRPAGVGGFGLALAILVGLGRVEVWTAQRTDSAPGVETKPNQRRTQNQPTRYYYQAPAMNWDHAVGWDRGVWVSVSDIGRVGSGWILNRTAHRLCSWRWDKTDFGIN